MPFPANWDVAADVEHVQLETYKANGQPHSVNIWCVVHNDRLFFTTSLVRGEEHPEKRRWVQNVLANHAARVKVADYIFEGNLRQIQELELSTSVKNAFGLKYDDGKEERTRSAWVFEFAKT